MGCKVEGFRELDRALSLLPSAVAKSNSKKALKEAAEPIRLELIRSAPLRTGELAASMKIAIAKNPEAGVAVDIGPTAFYGHFSEFGTSREPARPWARNAVAGATDQTFSGLGASLWKFIEKAWAKVKTR